MEIFVSRVQLALNVSNLQEAIEFYSKMFNATPAKVREGYANFAIVDPPLKLVLIETARDAIADYQHLNHLGVELETTAEVERSIERFEQLGLVDSVEKDTTCCYAVQDKVWMESPDGAPWEYYTVLSDAPTYYATADQKCC
jgi:catechol-2,3-dioxygenase